MDEFEKALQERFLLQEEYLGDNKPVNESFPLVSVTVTTYQHVNYIRDCLNGILMHLLFRPACQTNPSPAAFLL